MVKSTLENKKLVEKISTAIWIGLEIAAAVWVFMYFEFGPIIPVYQGY